MKIFGRYDKGSGDKTINQELCVPEFDILNKILWLLLIIDTVRRLDELTRTDH